MFGLLRHLFKLQFLFVVAAVLAGFYHTEIRQFLRRHTDDYLNQGGIPVAFQADDEVGTLFTPAELAQFNGEQEGRPLYLALLGSVFDVSRGIKHYGSGCSYNFFVGRDASVSFISGDFDSYDPETADDVLTLKPEDLLGLVGWRDFYEKDYIYKGRLIGRFYDDRGQRTTYHHKFLELLQQAQDAKRQADELRARYPGCNIEWSESQGTRVWCTNTSGDGKERSWIGHPRKLYSRGNKNFQCACVPASELDEIDAGGGNVAHADAMLKPYDNCEPRAQECFYRV
ncbi:neuferricin homolog [Drosophila elegans]|uniref:neuferricin homolog n=1 Tax=Drosophila elegans TaxID=30023 RepID=UPI0007E86116|nr:neuferricin homolog [Drosophila elegans]